MDVTVDPNVALFIFSESFEKILDIIDLRLEVRVRIDPLSI